MGHLDDKDMKPRPKCQLCRLRWAAWLVEVAASAPLKACTRCAKAAKGSRTPLRQRDY